MDFRVVQASDSCFLHRIIPVKDPFDEIPVYRLASNHCCLRETGPGFKSPPLKTPREPHFSEILVYRLPSNHSRSRETDHGFEFPTSEKPLGTRFQ